MARTVLLSCIIIFVVHAEEIEPEMKCAFKPCVLKCCPQNQHYISDGKCTKSEHNLDYSDFNVYEKNMRLTDKKVVRDLNLVPISNFNISFDSTIYISTKAHNTKFNIYLIENGDSYMETINALFRWTKRNSSQFCIEYLETKTKLDAVIYIEISDMNEETEDENGGNWEVILTFGLMISCLCLLVVLIVYCLLPELRNLGGMILMAYAWSLFVSYLCLFVMRIIMDQQIFVTRTCHILTFLIYFWLLASFFWMNVMSFDIWWTFRGYTKLRPIHRRGENFKFVMYSLYAFGVPLLMTGVFIYLFYADLSYTPWIVKPQINCFLAEDEKMLFLYTPMLILIVCNWLFFLLTAYNVWRLSRNVDAVFNSAAAERPSDQQQQTNRLMVYLKLSVVMGVSWVLEVLCYFVPCMKYIHIQDVYHSLIGLVIMLIFICKAKIINKLNNRFRKIRHLKPSFSISTTDCDVSLENPLQISSNPNGLQ